MQTTTTSNATLARQNLGLLGIHPDGMSAYAFRLLVSELATLTQFWFEDF